MDHMPLGRSRQLSWFPTGSIIRQDQDLIDFIKQSGAQDAVGFGDVDFFDAYIKFVSCGPVDLCIYIQTLPFDLDHLISHVNHIIQHDMRPTGKIYLAFNRYRIQPRRYANDLPDDFDQAIGAYVTSRVRAQVDCYLPCGLDGGLRFNWIHPLTRFYLSNNT